ncbi:hypothetical protein BDV93DRAFT_208737 [Ceratobasidium sp. AG-I]|nr:hypothetical protein BDV93DRAFT_208737 [Ceratobasidium sp. AG-I]
MLPDMTYAQVIRSFALVPLACFVLFVGLVLLITFAWAPLPDFPHSNVVYPYQPHARAFLVGAAGWIVSYSSRGAIYTAVTFGGRWASLTSVILSTILSVAAQEALRLGVLVLLGVRLHAWAGHPEWVPYPTPQDEAFRDVWWVALGCTIEAALSIFQGYEQLSLYKELFDARDRDEETWHNTNINSLQFDSRAFSRSAGSSAAEEDAKRAAALSPSDVASLMDDELTHSIQSRDREALELVFGVPLPNIPVFISCLQRVDAQILSIGFTLLISAAYVSDNRTNLFRGLIFGLVAALHSVLTIVWAEALPRIGIHTASYTSLLVAIGTFFAGLAFWGALE